jgi:hypothetical protein
LKILRASRRRWPRVWRSDGLEGGRFSRIAPGDAWNVERAHNSDRLIALC